jgi:hypothetical protein
MVKKKEEGEPFDGRIWPSILEFNVNIDSQLISKSNFIFGASTLILVFILNLLLSSESLSSSFIHNLPLMILLVGTFISSLLSMLIILPKIRIFSKKERIARDLFYYKNITKFYSRKQYCNALKNLPIDNKRIGEAYANQIYSLAKNIIPFKFKMLKISGWTLILSIFLSIIVYAYIFFIF